MTDRDLIDRVIEAEGGFVNDADDHGGATKFGVTRAVLERWRHAPMSDDDVKNLSLTEAREILIDLYILRPNFHLLGSDILRAVLVDFAVNSGPTSAIKAMQRCLKVAVDGVLGAETLHAANLRRGETLAQLVNAERVEKLGRIVTNDPSQAKFASGWSRRIADKIREVVLS